MASDDRMVGLIEKLEAVLAERNAVMAALSVAVKEATTDLANVRGQRDELLAALEMVMRRSDRSIGGLPRVQPGRGCVFCGKTTPNAAEVERQAGDPISARIEAAAAIEHQATCPILTIRAVIAKTWAEAVDTKL